MVSLHGNNTHTHTHSNRNDNTHIDTWWCNHAKRSSVMIWISKMIDTVYAECEDTRIKWGLNKANRNTKISVLFALITEDFFMFKGL